MTIKEIEELAEMPRANIRFYEAEGLLRPTRSVNGYRDYSKEDLAVIKKIKLLRSLHMSLEEIKALHTGEQELSDVLEQQIKRLSADKKELDKAQAVCEIMYRDGSRYESLDTEKYLQNLKNEVNTTIDLQEKQIRQEEPHWDAEEAYEDVMENVQSPWRRLFARSLDESVYAVLWKCFLILVFKVNFSNRNTLEESIVDFVAIIFLTLILEPLQLSLFGTTLGKWILGLHVWHNDDRKLTFQEAFARTRQVLFYGQAFRLPFFSWWRLWRSYLRCVGPETLVWEYDSRLILRDKKKYRFLNYIAVAYAIIPAIVWAMTVWVQIPMHRGELTVAEFCENYRQLAEYYGTQSGYTLEDDGTWSEYKRNPNGMLAIELTQGPPRFIFETDSEGNIQKITVRAIVHVSENMPKGERPIIRDSWLQTYMELTALSFIGAQDDFSHFSSDRIKMLKAIDKHEFKDFNFTEVGINVNCDMEYEGFFFVESVDFLAPEDKGICKFSMEYTISK